MKLRYQDQSVTIRYRNPFTRAERQLTCDLTSHGYMARLDREWQARAAEHAQQARDRSLAEAHAAWQQMRADGVNADTRQLDQAHAQMMSRTRAQARAAGHTAQHTRPEAEGEPETEPEAGQ